MNWLIFYSRTMLTKWNRDRCEVGVVYGILNGSEADLTVDTSKLMVYKACEQVSEFYLE